MAIAMTDRKIRLYHRDDLNIPPVTRVTLFHGWPSILKAFGIVFFIEFMIFWNIFLQKK